MKTWAVLSQRRSRQKDGDKRTWEYRDNFVLLGGNKDKGTEVVSAVTLYTREGLGEEVVRRLLWRKECPQRWEVE